MTPERWQAVQAVFHRLLEMPESERPSALVKLCGGDRELQRQVAALVRADAGTGDVAEKVVGNTVDQAISGSELVGRRLGPYQILNLLGRGGMGTVYLAERVDGHFRQQVAIKLVRPGLDDEQIVLRLRQERQIMAALQHPSIARLLDGGATDDGRPYVVMEYVRGSPIDEHCDQRELSVPNRIGLFREVCAAVHHAHRNLILHRDLKPANILVTEDGEPKLLDFGIAKLLDVDTPFTKAETEPGARLLTPAFASPEQVRGEVLTTASDVYSLGVLLYLLLTGQLPYRVGRSGADLARVLSETEPIRPSTAVRNLTPEKVAIQRGVRPERLRRLLSGDLDTIVLAALRKEPERRYASVEQLSEDLRRHLERLPIRARPDTLGYRAGKFIERHRLLVAAMLLVILSLVGGMVTTTWQARRTLVQQQRAEWVLELLLETVSQADPEQALGREVTVREVLDRFSASLSPGSAPDDPWDQPEDRAKLLDTAGRAYLGLGRPEDAEPVLEQGLLLRRQVSTGDDPDLADSLAHLAELRHTQGRFAEAEALLLEALALRRKIFGERHLSVAKSLNDLAAVAAARGHPEQAGELYERALDILRATVGEAHKEYAQTLANQGAHSFRAGRLAEAETQLARALELRRELFGPIHPDVTGNAIDLAAVYSNLQRPSEAEALMRRTLRRQLEVLASDHPQVARCQQNLATILSMQGRFEEAELLYRQALTSQRGRLGEQHPSVAMMASNLADLRVRQGDRVEAQHLYQQALNSRRQPNTPPAEFAVALVRLANVLLTTQPAEAEGFYREAQALNIEVPAQGVDTSTLSLRLGQSLMRQDRVAEAEAPLRQAVALLSERRGPEATATVKAATVKAAAELAKCLRRLAESGLGEKSGQGDPTVKVAKPPARSAPDRSN